MGRIHILPDAVKRKIAAGEVIEGPFSIVKELVENALDAGAGHVDVSVQDSGMKRISVRDDGAGISREDLPLAVMEHATSKISDIHDIETVNTFGFRGEALSSISAVSRFTLLSRAQGEETGGRVMVSGDMVEVSDWAGPAGTTVIAENLFWNVPARKKFLKSPATELRLLREALVRAAISAHGTAFTLETDGARTLSLPAVSTAAERLEQVLGRETASHLFHENLDDIKVRLTAYLSGPDGARGNRSLQYLYVNGRPVEYRYLGFILSRAYESYLPKGRYPVAVIFLELPPELVDVNIHPAKREVKFFDGRYIDSMIFGLAGKVLSRPLAVETNVFRENTAAVVRDEGPDQASIPFPRGEFRSVLFARQDGGLAQGPPPAMERPATAAGGGAAPEGPVRILGQALGTYIVVDDGDALQFIDFHAAHERILYDLLVEGGETAQPQELLFPETVELSVEEYALVIDNADGFRRMGLEVEEFGPGTVVIRSVPAAGGNGSAAALLRLVLDEMMDNRDGDSRRAMAAGVACHAARRAGDVLGNDEMSLLVERVLSGRHELRCPHGRPYIYRLEKNDLERLFRRQ